MLLSNCTVQPPITGRSQRVLLTQRREESPTVLQEYFNQEPCRSVHLREDTGARREFVNLRPDTEDETNAHL